MVNKGQLSLSHSLKKRYTKVRVKITKKNARPTNRNKFLISHDFILLLDLLSFFFSSSFIRVYHCYSTKIYGATESCSRLRRLQHASTTVDCSRCMTIDRLFCFYFSEYYDYELHVVEWG